MTKHWCYGQRARLLRCDGCGDHYDECVIRQILRPAGRGTVQICRACWEDIWTACQFGGHDRGELLEQLAEAAAARTGIGRPL